MSSDAGSPITPPRPFLLDLPHIRDLRIRRVPFQAPRLEHFTSSLSRHTEAIEFIAELEGPIPVRSYGPALYVGDVEVNQSERLDATTWRFLAFEPDRLQTGAPIGWGWMKDPPSARRPTQFRYQLQRGIP
jgi:hypothetical protein